MIQKEEQEQEHEQEAGGRGKEEDGDDDEGEEEKSALTGLPGSYFAALLLACPSPSPSFFLLLPAATIIRTRSLPETPRPPPAAVYDTPNSWGQG